MEKKIKVLKSTYRTLEEKIDREFETVIGSSEEIKQLMETVEKISTTDANILILGENGTGKEHLAREIHRRSNRKNNIFVHVDLMKEWMSRSIKSFFTNYCNHRS